MKTTENLQESKNDTFKAMTDKQLNYIKKLEREWSYVDGESNLLKTIKGKRDKISTRLASKVISHLQAYNNFMVYASRHKGISMQDMFAAESFDDEEKIIIRVIESL